MFIIVAEHFCYIFSYILFKLVYTFNALCEVKALYIVDDTNMKTICIPMTEDSHSLGITTYFKRPHDRVPFILYDPDNMKCAIQTTH